MKRICAAIVVVFAMLGGAWSQGVEEHIKKMETERAAAVVKGDTDTLAKMTSDDYMLINVNGQMWDKAHTMEAIKSGQIKLSQDDVSDLKVRVYGNTAVVTGKADVKGTIAGKDASGQILFTRVYVKKGGKWLSVAFQQTKVE
ncbi:MAG TPA: nuclear transport factor 2 family protein [Terriglobales bacterium]